MKFLGFDKSQVNTIEAKEFLLLLLLFRKNLALLSLPLKNMFNQIFNCDWLVAWKPFVLWIFRGQSNGTSFPNRLPPLTTSLSGGYKRQKLMFHRFMIFSMIIFNYVPQWCWTLFSLQTKHSLCIILLQNLQETVQQIIMWNFRVLSTFCFSELLLLDMNNWTCVLSNYLFFVCS